MLTLIYCKNTSRQPQRRALRGVYWALALLLAALASPAGAGIFDDNEARQAVSELSVRSDKMEKKLAGLAQQSKDNAADLQEKNQEIQSLQGEVGRLRKELEALRSAFDASRERSAAQEAALVEAQAKPSASDEPAPLSAEAMLGLANVHTQLKDTKAARKVLEDLVQRFPGSKPALVAKERLALMK